MADTGAPWNIPFRGVGELAQPINEITEEMAEGVHAALNKSTGTSAVQTALPAVAGWTQNGVYAQIGKLIIAHFEWIRTGADIGIPPPAVTIAFGTLPVGVRPAAANVRTILYNSSVGAGGIQPRLTITSAGAMSTSSTSIATGNSLTGSLTWIAA